jgi:hypothetical protein
MTNLAAPLVAGFPLIRNLPMVDAKKADRQTGLARDSEIKLAASKLPHIRKHPMPGGPKPRRACCIVT